MPLTEAEELELLKLKAKAAATEEGGYLAGLGKYYTHDIPETAKGAVGRFKERAARIEAPTVLGGIGQSVAGRTGVKADIAEGVAGGPEKLTRAFAGAFGTLAEPVAMGTELALRAANRISGGKFGEWFGKGVENLTETEVAQNIGKWWSSLSEADKANYGAIPDLLDALGFQPGKAMAKTAKPSRVVNIGGESITLPRGGAGLQRVTGSLPGGRGAKGAYAGQVKKSVMKAIGDIRGTDEPFEEVAERVARTTTGTLKRQAKQFDEAFGQIIEAGKHGTKQGTTGAGMNADAWASTLRRVVNQDAPVFQGIKKGADLTTVPTGLSDDAMKQAKRFVDKVNDLDQVSVAKRYEVFRNEKSQLGNIAFGPQSKNLSAPDKNMLRGLYRKAVELERDFIAQQSAFWKVDRDKILKLFDATNAYYGETKPIRDYTKRIIGYSEEIGEKGHKNAQKALRELLAPDKQEELAKLMTLLDDDAKQHLRNGLLIKFVDDTLIENKEFVSLTKLQKQLDRYGRKGLAKILGDDKVAQIENLIDGMERTGANTLKFADPTNKSGTGAAWFEKMFFAGTTIGGFISPKTAIAAAGGAYLNRLVSHIVFNQPLSALERMVGGAPGLLTRSMIGIQGPSPSALIRGAGRGIQTEEEKQASPVLGSFR